MSPEQAKVMAEALTGGGCDTHGQNLSSNACEAAADELNILMQAIHNGAADWIVCNVMSGIESRLRAAAKLNEVIAAAEAIQ